MSDKSTHPGGKTQCERIWSRLLQTPNEPVPMPELARAGAANAFGFCMVHSRVAELRKRRGALIEHTQEGGAHFYTLRVG